MKKTNKARILTKVFATMLTVGMTLLTTNIVSYAVNGKTVVSGRVYEFGEDSHYEFSDSTESKPADSENTYGSFSINGNIGEVFSKDGVPAYQVEDGWT